MSSVYCAMLLVLADYTEADATPDTFFLSARLRRRRAVANLRISVMAKISLVHVLRDQLDTGLIIAIIRAGSVVQQGRQLASHANLRNRLRRRDQVANRYHLLARNCFLVDRRVVKADALASKRGRAAVLSLRQGHA